MILVLPLYDDNPTVRAPIVTCALIGLCAAGFLYEIGGDGEAVVRTYGMVPAAFFGDADPAGRLAAVPPWATLFTSMFLHSGWLHLGGNMLFLWIFGNNIEDVLGHARYLALYLGSGVAAALAQGVADPQSTVPMVGASGAIAGVLGAYLLIYPRAGVHVLIWIILFVRIITVPAWVMLGVWFALQLVSGLVSDAGEAGVAFWAHIGGFCCGLVLLRLLRPAGVELWQTAGPKRFAAPPGMSRPYRASGGSVPAAGPSYRPPRGR